MTVSGRMRVVQSKHWYQQVQVWHGNQPVVEGHRQHTQAIPGMMIDPMREWVVMIPRESPPPKGRGGTGAPPSGGGKAGRGSSNNKEMGESNHEDNNDKENLKESEEEDPVSSHTGKAYTLKTKEGKEMARMLVSVFASPDPVPTP